MYRALYRQYRPQRFDEVVGQEAITGALSNQITHDKIGHAYLFTGTRGTGKTTCAKIFAKAVNCENPDGAEPCGKCVCCVGMENGSILDVVEIDAASNNGVDDVRDLRDETAYRPSRCRFRVYIIDEVHMLSTAAFNALLKILEEPPSHVIFILATTEIHKVPATILSRCQRFDFLRIPAEKIAGRLTAVAEEEGIRLDAGAADLIARLADGGMRDALSLLDTCAGLGEDVDEALVRKMAGVSDRSYLFAISGAVAQGNVQEILRIVADLRAKSIDVRRLCEELVFHYRNFLLARAGQDGSLLENVPADDRQRYLDGTKTVGEVFAISAVRRLAEAMDKMGRSPDPRIELELALFDLGEKAQKAGQAAASAAQAPQAPVPPPAVAAPPPPQAPPEDDKPPFDMPEPEPPPQEEAPPTAPQAAPMTVEAPAAPEPPPPTGQKTAPEGMTLFPQWDEVLKQMAGTDRLLYSYMKASTGYINGGRVLIEGGDMFVTFMKQNEFARTTIKKVIAEVSGKMYAIGPYKPPETAAEKQISAEDTLKQWEAQGVEIIKE